MPLLRRRLHPERLDGHPVSFRRSQAAPRVVWRFSDGKPGHDNQSLGLTDALQRLQELERDSEDVMQLRAFVAARQRSIVR